MRIALVGRWLCVAGAMLGALALVGWISGLPFLVTLIPGQPPMVPNTAIALALAGVAGALLHPERPGRAGRIGAVLSALAVIALALSTLAEYALDTDLHIDELVLRRDIGRYPGRMSPLTAMALVPLGLAILLIDWLPTAHRRPSEWLAIIAALTALVGLAGQLLGAGPMYGAPATRVMGMAVPTAVSLLLTSVGLLLERPNAGITAVAKSAGPGGVMVRRLVLPSVLLPTLLGFIITTLFVSLRVEELPLVVGTVAVAMTALGLAVLGITGLLLNRSHDALEASEARTRALISHASDAIFIADLDGRFIDVNAAGCQLLGLPESEIIGERIRDFLPPEDAERLPAARQVLAKGGTQMAEWHLRRKTGAYVPVEVSATILPDGRWEAFVRDISKRKAAEEEARRLERELRDARLFLENVLESSTDYSLVALDLDRRVLFWNEGARRIFGYSSEEIVGKTADVLHVQSDLDSGVAYSLYARALDRGSADSLLQRRRKDGSEFLAHIVVSRRTAGDGSPSGYLLISRNVTREQRRSEQDHLLAVIGLLLTSSLDRKQVVSSAAELLVRDFADACIVDLVDEASVEPSVVRSLVVHRDSRKKELALALEKARLDSGHSYLSSASLESRRTTLVSHVTGEYLDSIAQSTEHRRLLEQLAPVSLISVPLQARGVLFGVLTFVSSNQKRRYDKGDAAFVEEIGLRVALSIDNARLFETATRAVAARDDVLRVVAHDLRNPLGTILMQASLLRSNAIEANGGVRKPAESIERAAKRMNRLIKDLLDVTRLEAGHLSVDQSSVSGRAIVCDSVDAHQALASQASLELRTELGEDLPEVWADRDRLLQIFENLIGNAIKFTRPGGSITVGATRHEADVLFWVKDTGEGISEEQLPHVFDRFWQAGKADGGAGLGLTIVKALVEAHGGRVWVESAPGTGSTFYFTVPVAQRPAQHRRAIAGHPVRQLAVESRG